MAVIDREILTRQIRDAVDIVELVGGYVALRRAGANFKGLCPFHEEKTPSFNVHPVKQIFKCYGCGAGGDVFTFLQMREKVDFLEARRMLAERAGISLEQQSDNRGGPGKTDLSRVNQWAQRVFRRNYESATGEAAREYVARRGISEESAAAFGIGLAVDSFDSLVRQAQVAKANVQMLVAAGLARENQRGGYYDVFRNRLMFPIADATGRIIGFGGRTLGEDPAKYINTPATALFDKSTNLFGLDRARQAISAAGRTIVVEGYTDCIMAHQYGFTETVATLGTAMTDAHAGLLRRYADHVVLLFDSDQAGQKAADRALSVTLTSGLDVALTRVPEGKDPCDYLLSAGKIGFESVLKASVPALEFKWHLVAREYEESATGPGRRRAIEAYLSQLSSWLGHGAVDPIQLGLLVNQLGKILALPPEELHTQLLQMSRRTNSATSRRAPVANVSAEQKAGGEQKALRQILEVLLNEPERYPDVADVFDPAAIQDPSIAAVAKAFVALCNTRGPEGLTLAEVISEFELPSFGQLITDLQMCGEQRGNYEAVIRGATEQALPLGAQMREAARAAEQVRRERENQAGTLPPQGEDERLLAIAKGVKTGGADRIVLPSAKWRKKFLT